MNSLFQMLKSLVVRYKAHKRRSEKTHETQQRCERHNKKRLSQSKNIVNVHPAIGLYQGDGSGRIHCVIPARNCRDVL